MYFRYRQTSMDWKYVYSIWLCTIQEHTCFYWDQIDWLIDWLLFNAIFINISIYICNNFKLVNPQFVSIKYIHNICYKYTNILIYILYTNIHVHVYMSKVCGCKCHLTPEFSISIYRHWYCKVNKNLCFCIL